MKYLQVFENFGCLNEGYNYDRIRYDEYECLYSFCSNYGVEYSVKFEKIDSATYERSYKANNKFEMSNNGDAISILRTLTDITVEFLNKYEPYMLIINHLDTKKESDRWGFATPTAPNKRALSNKRFLENSLPPTYMYTLTNSSKAMIIRKN